MYSVTLSKDGSDGSATTILDKSVYTGYGVDQVR
jgi:hypothetical protein